MTSGIHYVFAAYLGPRRVEDPRQVNDRFFFVREHLASLGRLAHNLAQITLVVQQDVQGKAFDTSQVPATIQGTPVKVVVRANDAGLSYGGLLHVIDERFPYTIFNEDDYVFTQDHFDEHLAGLLVSTPEAALVCGCARGHVDGLVHAAVSTGIARTDALVKVRDAACLGRVGEIAQARWSIEVGQQGVIVDWLCTAACGYWTDDAVRWLERSPELGQAGDPIAMEPPTFRPALLVPIQALDHEVFVCYWRAAVGYWRKRLACVGRDGAVTWCGPERD